MREIDRGSLDGAIASTCAKRSGLLIDIWTSDPLYLAVSRKSALLRHRELKSHHLKDQLILLLHESHCLSVQVRRWCSDNKLNAVDEIPVLQFGTLLARVSAGHGVAFVPGLSLGKESSHGCKFVPFAQGGPVREITFIRNGAHHQTKAATAFITHAARLVTEMVAAPTRRLQRQASRNRNNT